MGMLGTDCLSQTHMRWHPVPFPQLSYVAGLLRMEGRSPQHLTPPPAVLAGLTVPSNQAHGCASSHRSWQSVTFERQPASFIRIVGTHNTANEVRVSVMSDAVLFPDIQVNGTSRAK